MRKLIKSLPLLACAFLLSSQKPQAADAPLRKVTVAEFGDIFLYLPLYIAQEEGFFAAHGLEVNAVGTGNDDKTFAALVSGDAQFGISDPTFAAIARTKGKGGKVVAAVVTGVPLWGVAKPAVPVIEDAAQLKPYTVGTYPSPTTAFTLQQQMFKQAGLPPKIRQGAFGTLLPLLEAGQIDIALEIEPNVSTAIGNGDHVVYSMAKLMPKMLFTGVEVLDEVAAKDPALVQAFVSSIDEAEKFAHAHPDRAIADAQKHFPDIDKTILHDGTMRMLNEGTLPASALIAEAAWDTSLQMRIDAGDLPSLAAAKGTLDDSYAEKAQQTP